MSHSGWSGSNYISAVAGSFSLSAPVTLYARHKHVSTGSIQTLVDLNFSSTQRFQLRVNSADNPVANTQATSNATATGATTLSAGVWYSLLGLFTSATDRKIFVNGVQDGSDTTSRTPTGAATKIRVGLGADNFNPSGSPMAEVAVWSVALSADEIASLAFKSPRSIRPDALVYHGPLLENATIDLVAPAATVTGTLTKDNDHPRVIYPRALVGVAFGPASGGGATTSLPPVQASPLPPAMFLPMAWHPQEMRPYPFSNAPPPPAGASLIYRPTFFDHMIIR